MVKATVIIPTTANPVLIKALESVKSQSIKTDIFLVCDGMENHHKLNELIYGSKLDNLHYLRLPYNVGGDGFYGHRTFAAIPHFINTDYLLFLDEDNWLEPNHVESLIGTVENFGYDWAYSLRNIVDKDGIFVCKDDSESLGKYENCSMENHIDTSCYLLRKHVAIQTSWAFNGKYGQDRIFYNVLRETFKYYDCSGKYTLNYRLDGNPKSVKKEFFLKGNEVMRQNYGENYFNQWRK